MKTTYGWVPIWLISAFVDISSQLNVMLENNTNI